MWKCRSTTNSVKIQRFQVSKDVMVARSYRRLRNDFCIWYFAWTLSFECTVEIFPKTMMKCLHSVPDFVIFFS